MIFQKPSPFPMTVFDNVAYGLRQHYKLGRAELSDRVEDALKRSAIWDEVKHKLNEPGNALSGGQQQRLCIARAIAAEPEVLLMDEPCSAIDPVGTAKIEELILELKSNYTIVLVTHNMQQAARVSDYTAFFFQGHIVEFGADDADLLESGREEDRGIHHRPLRLSREVIMGHLQRETERLKRKVLGLGAIVEDNLRLAFHAIDERDAAKARRVIATDALVDQNEVESRRSASRSSRCTSPSPATCASSPPSSRSTASWSASATWRRTSPSGPSSSWRSTPCRCRQA